MQPTESSFAPDAILSGDEPDGPVVAWTLDELDHSTDLATLRGALASTDDRYA